MNKFHGKKSDLRNKADELIKQGEEKAAHVYLSAKENAESLTEHVKDTVAGLYDEGKQKISTLEEHIEEYSDHVVKKVKRNPLTSLLIAGGIGFILSHLLRK